MFVRKTRKSFHVSTSRMYLSGRKTLLTRALHFMRPYTSHAGYRSVSGGALVAL